MGILSKMFIKPGNSTNSTVGNGGTNSTVPSKSIVLSPAEAVVAAEKAALAAEKRLFQSFTNLEKYAKEIWVQIVAFWNKYHYYIIRYVPIGIGALVVLVLLACCCVK